MFPGEAGLELVQYFLYDSQFTGLSLTGDMCTTECHHIFVGYLQCRKAKKCRL